MKKIFLFAGFFLMAQSSLLAQCLVIPPCPNLDQTVCDSSSNDNSLWNDAAFFDPAAINHNLGESSTDLSIQIADLCGTGNIQVSFVLLLDLDGMASRETAVSSLALPGTDTVYFGNAVNPNYSGGEGRAFDNRPVPANQKYAFALEKTVQDNVLTARVRWVTAQMPGNYVAPQLPYGKHRIEWRVEKDGEVKTCGYNFTVKDCQPPTVACLSGLAVEIQPTQQVQLFVSDLLQSAQDNYTHAPQLKYAVRRAGAGTGFPVNATGQPVTSVVFFCDDLGAQLIELWAMDGTGNAGYCETSVIVQANLVFCDPSGAQLEACAAYHCDGTALPDVSFALSGTNPGAPPFGYFLGVSDSSGCVSSGGAFIPQGSIVTVSPSKEDPAVKGVDILDIVLISRHILGLEPLNSPYKIIAADVNRSGSVTSFDLVEIQKVILGLYSDWPNNVVWRFLDSAFVFPNPQNPFQSAYQPGADTIYTYLAKKFYGIKTGDVNCSYMQSTSQLPVEYLTIPNLNLQANDTVEVPVRFVQTEGRLGFQFGLHFDPTKIQILDVLPSAGITTPGNFGILPGQVNTSWWSGGGMTFPPNQPVFQVRIKALAPVQLADIASLDTLSPEPEAYWSNLQKVRLRLQFGTVATTEPGVLQVFPPQPNPTAAGLYLPVQLAQSAPLTLELLDAMGRLIYRRDLAASAGAQTLEIPATAFPQAGAYLWRVQVGTEFRTGKVLKL